MRVLIIPEDDRKDRFILLPIIAAMLAHLGKPKAKVEVCVKPPLRGVTQAMDKRRIREIIDYYPLVHLFLLCVDRDGKVGRREALNGLERDAEKCLRKGRLLLAENAWQEIEVWALAGHDLPRKWKWDEIRQETDPKEKYFQPFVTLRGLQEEPGGGRETLAREAAGRYRSIRNRCKEDVLELESRIKTWLDGRA
jgi:hypothetical protein